MVSVLPASCDDCANRGLPSRSARRRARMKRVAVIKSWHMTNDLKFALAHPCIGEHPYAAETFEAEPFSEHAGCPMWPSDPYTGYGAAGSVLEALLPSGGSGFMGSDSDCTVPVRRVLREVETTDALAEPLATLDYPEFVFKVDCMSGSMFTFCQCCHEELQTLRFCQSDRLCSHCSLRLKSSSHGVDLQAEEHSIAKSIDSPSSHSAELDEYKHIFGDLVEHVLEAMRLEFPRVYNQMAESEEFGKGISQGIVRADARKRAIECLVDELVTQMLASVQSEKAKGKMNEHMFLLRLQVERGIEDMFQLAEMSCPPFK